MSDKAREIAEKIVNSIDILIDSEVETIKDIIQLELGIMEDRIIELEGFIADNEIVLKSANSDAKRMTKYVVTLEQERAEVVEGLKIIRPKIAFRNARDVCDNLLAKLEKK